MRSRVHDERAAIRARKPARDVRRVANEKDAVRARPDGEAFETWRGDRRRQRRGCDDDAGRGIASELERRGNSDWTRRTSGDDGHDAKLIRDTRVGFDRRGEEVRAAAQESRTDPGGVHASRRFGSESRRAEWRHLDVRRGMRDKKLHGVVRRREDEPLRPAHVGHCLAGNAGLRRVHNAHRDARRKALRIRNSARRLVLLVRRRHRVVRVRRYADAADDLGISDWTDHHVRDLRRRRACRRFAADGQNTSDEQQAPRFAYYAHRFTSDKQHYRRPRSARSECL